MGDSSLYVRGAPWRCTTDLDQSGKLRVQVCQRTLQDFAVTRVVGCFELLEHVLAGQHQTLPAAQAGNQSGCQRWLRGAASGVCFSLLILNRLALPSSRHRKIIAANRGSERK